LAVSTDAVRREVCVVCGAGGLDPIVTVHSFPVFQGCVAFEPESGECAPMPWAACESCGSAQIVTLPAMDRIYQAGHATGLGAAWTRHHTAFASFLSAHVDGRVVDIGGGSGTLATAYRRSRGKAPWTILEPNALRSAELPSDVDVVQGFLDEDVLKRLGAGTVVMCHMLEHVMDLRATIRALSNSLPEDGIIVLAWPELETWTRAGTAGALNFEHGIYVTAPRLVALFSEFGWRKTAKQRFAENDTVFMAFRRGRARTAAQARTVSSAPAVTAYYSGFRTSAQKIMSILEKHSGDAFLMPASVYAQTLIASGVREDRFTALLDNAPIKQGRRLYGTTLRVAAPAARLAEAETPLVVLNGGAHATEIASQLCAIRADVRIVNGRGEPLHSPAANAIEDRQILPRNRSAAPMQRSNA
jgi:hypothetical protein